MAFSLDEYKKKKEADASASKAKQTTSGGFSLTEYAKQKAAAQEPAVAASTVSVKTPVTKQQAQANKANALAEDLVRQQATDYLAAQRYNKNLPTSTTPAQAAQSKADSLYAQNLLNQEIGRAEVRAQQEAAQPVYDLDYQAAKRLDINRQLVNAQEEIDRLEEQRRTMDFTGRNDGSVDAPLMAAYQRLAELQGQSEDYLSNDEIETMRQAQASRERTQKLMTMNVPLARETTDRLEALQEDLRTLQFTGANQAAVNDILRQIAELQGSGYVTDRSDLAEAEKLQRLTALENVRYNQDYGVKRLYDPQYGIQSSEWSGARQTYDVQGDLIYDYVNGKNDARAMELADSLSNGAWAAGVDLSRLKEMTKDEKYVYNYLYATQGMETANEYLQLLSSELNAKQMQGLRDEVAAFAKEHPVAASVASVPMGWAKGLSYLGQIVDYAKDGEIDQNAGYNRYTLIPSTIREEVSSRWGAKGSFAYQTAMSMFDFLSQAMLSGSFGAEGAGETISEIASLGIMGTGAAADGTLAALNRGLSSKQAMSLGTIAGVAEAATELVSIETLLDMTDMDKSIVGYLLKNFLAEGSEEVASDFINLFADVITAKDRSEWSQSVQAYVADGYDEKEAFWNAFSDQAAQMSLDFLGGALSGLAMAGGMIGVSIGSNIANAASDARKMRKLERTLTDFVKAQNEELTRQVEEAKQNPAEAAQAALASEQAAIPQENAQTAPDLTQNGEMAAEATQAAPAQAAPQTQEQQAQTERRQLLQSYADTMTGNLGSTMTEMYNGQQDVGAYAGAMTEAYNVGRDGGALADIDADVAQLISPEQRIAAYNAGRMDAITTTNNQNGGMTSGTAEVSVRESGEWNDRANPGESVRGLEESAGRASDWERSTRRAADSGAARLSYSEGVSLASFGVSGGSRSATLHTVVGGTTESLTSAETLCRQRGLRLVAVAGDNLVVTQRMPDGTKQTITARALIIGDRIFARVDDPDFTIDQIVRHEAGHDMIRKGEIDLKEVRQKLEKVMDIDQAAQMYAEAYAMSGEQMSPDEIWEEMICDSLGDMNAFKGGVNEGVGQYVTTQVKAAAEENRSERAARAPPENNATQTVDNVVKFSRNNNERNRALRKGEMEMYANITNPFEMEMSEDEANKVYDKYFAPFHEDKFGTYRPHVVHSLMVPYKVFDYLKEAAEANGTTTSAILSDLGYDGVHSGIEWVAFDSNQLKNVSNTRPTGSNDIRFSRVLREIDQLRRENDQLRERVEYFKGQTHTTKQASVRLDDVKKFSGSIVKSYDSTVKAADIQQSVKELGDLIVRGGDYTDVRDRAMTIARNIVENASVLVDDANAEMYRELRDVLRSRQILVSKADAEKIADYKDWRRRYNGRLRLKNSESSNIDVVYADLAEQFPGLFPEDIKNPGDQLEHFGYLVDAYRDIYQNPYSYNMAVVIEDCANDIIDGLTNGSVRLVDPTYADRAQQRQADALLAGQMSQGRQDAARLRRTEEQYRQKLDRAQQRLKDVRDERSDAIQNAFLSGEIVQGKKDAAQIRRANQKIERMRQSAEAQRGRRSESEARTRLLKIVKRLQNKKLPEVSRSLLNQYIAYIDTTAKSLTQRKLNDIRDLRDWYEDRKDNDPDFIADEGVEKTIARLGNRQIANMSIDEVIDLTNVLLNIENEIRTERKLIDEQDRRDTYQMGVAVINDVKASKGSNEIGVAAAIDKYIVTETLSPLRQIRRMVGYVADDPLLRLTESLANGQRNMFDYQMRASKRFDKWTSDKNLVDRITGKHAEEIKITGISSDGVKTVTITPAMRMSLYLHSLNSDNMRHIAGGGITVPNWILYKAGRISDAYARGTTIKLTPSEVKSITDRMPDDERAFAKAAHDYFNGMSRDEINAVSEKLKGYSLAGVENYFPINTDTNFTKKDFDSLKFDGTIEGMGFLKERIDASGPIVLRDLNSVLNQSIDQHARYVGLAIPVRNFNKVWGVTKSSYKDDGSRSSFESSVQQAVSSAWGETGKNYVEKMMKDINGSTSTRTDNWGRAFDKLRSSYAGSVLTLNLSVAMKQAASYPTAAAVIGFKPLTKAMKNFGKVDLDLIAKYTPLQWYRSQGFTSQELGDIAKRGKSIPAALNWIQYTDLVTTRKLWKAAEYYIRDTQSGLTRGSEEYYKAVAGIYNQIIEETQPNYTTMQRPQILRSDNTLVQNLAMFKTQPFQNFNIVYDAFGNLDAQRRRYINIGSDEAKADYHTAKKRAAWAVTSQVAQLAVFSAMTFVWNMLRGKRDKYKDDDDEEMTFEGFVKGIGKDMLSGAASTVPFGADVWGLLSSILTDETYYGMDAVAPSALTDAASSIVNFASIVSGVWSSSKSGEDVDWHDVTIKCSRIANDVSKVLGIPAENVTNLFNAFFQKAAKASGGKYIGQYQYLKLTTQHANAAAYYDNLYAAYRNNYSSFRLIYDDMISGGFDADLIKKNMENRMKAEAGVSSVKDLSKRFTP